jgi:hypothetical protein
MNTPKFLRLLFNGKTIGFISPTVLRKKWQDLMVEEEPLRLIPGGFCEDCEHWTKLTGLGVCQALNPYVAGEGDEDGTEQGESFALLVPVDLTDEGKPHLQTRLITAKDFGCRIWSAQEFPVPPGIMSWGSKSV